MKPLTAKTSVGVEAAALARIEDKMLAGNVFSEKWTKGGMGINYLCAPNNSVSYSAAALVK